MLRGFVARSLFRFHLGGDFEQKRFKYRKQCKQNWRKSIGSHWLFMERAVVYFVAARSVLKRFSFTNAVLFENRIFESL